MKIGLLNLEPEYKNLAIEKLRLFHSNNGDFVEDYFALNTYDKVYCSSIFNFTKKFIIPQGAICGGSGFDLTTILPPEIDALKPKLNFGFTTRGCIRKCPFCIVPQKEGYVKVVGDIYDLWDGKSKELVLFDNNILALPEHFKTICSQIRKESLRVDFNQGLDHRLLTEELWGELNQLKHIHEIRFAFDNVGYINSVNKALSIMKNNGLKDWQTRWYVYVGVDDTFDTVYPRLKLLRDNNQHAYLMRDNRVHDNPMWIAMSTWTSFQGAFKMELDVLLRENDRFRGYAKYFPIELRG